MVERIAIISEHASPLATLGGVDSGGQNVYVGQIAKHLAALGCKVDIFTRRNNECMPEIVRSINGVRIVHVRAGPTRFVRKEDLLPFMAEFADNLLAFCRRQTRPYDVLHANFFMSGMAAMHIKRHLRIPFVITFHALGRVRRLHQKDADEFPEERPLIEKRIIAAADKVIAECPQDKEDMIRLYRAKPSKIAVVPCGFDPMELWPVDKSDARAVLNLDPNDRIVLQLGRMVPRKGVDIVIRALSLLAKTYGIDAKLLVVGGDSDRPDTTATPEIGRLQRIAEAEGIGERVIFAGRCRRGVLRYYYSAADIFVTTPWYEPFGITPVEAMACGVPVVGAAVGGIKTTVCDGETGFLVPPHAPEATAERLARLFTQPVFMRLFGTAGLKRAHDYFTWAKVTDRLASVYASAAQGASRDLAGRALRKRAS
ncbi:MAG: glycosyltransferase family 1 protein [Gammaproteobacteria bacterium]